METIHYDYFGEAESKLKDGDLWLYELVEKKIHETDNKEVIDKLIEKMRSMLIIRM